MNRYSLKESDFKSDVSTNSTKRASNYYNIPYFIFLTIPQFDLLTLGAQIFGLLSSLYLFYYYCITTSISYFIEIKKLRTKKLLRNNELVNTIDKDLNYNLWLINYSYVNFLK